MLVERCARKIAGNYRDVSARLTFRIGYFLCCFREFHTAFNIATSKVAVIFIRFSFASPNRYFTENSCWVPLAPAALWPRFLLFSVQFPLAFLCFIFSPVFSCFKYLPLLGICTCRLIKHTSDKTAE